MFFRCKHCHALGRVELGPETLRLSCHCGQPSEPRHDWRQLGASRDEHFAKARELSRAAAIDIPTAYSVLLGIIPLTGVRPDETERRLDSSCTAKDPDAGAPDVPPTPERRRAQGVSAPRKRRVLTRLALGVGLTFLVASGPLFLYFGLRRVEPDPDRWRPHLESREWADVEIRTDDLGRVTAVSGPDPLKVLVAYCNATPGCEPIEVAMPVPASADRRLGVFLDGRAGGRRLALEIEREGLQSWSVGRAGLPPAVIEAPELPPGTATFPVSR